MRLDSIALSNVRIFDDLKLDLDPRLTVLMGRNASGKTSVLDGIAVALGAWLGGFRSISQDCTFHTSWARLVRSEQGGVESVSPVYPVRVEAAGEILGEPVRWARELRGVRGRTTTGEASRVRELAQHAERESRAATFSTLPVVAYYGTGRLWVHKRTRKRQTLRPSRRNRLDGYWAALESASDQKGLEAWMRRLESDRLQQLQNVVERGGPAHPIRVPLLTVVERAVVNCLEGVDSFSYSMRHEELRVRTESGMELPFSDLSDGQRNLATVAADIAWRAGQLNPHLGEAATKSTPGVVLIDEVELHLHPAWQRQVLPDLVRTFPHIQFIVTSHSPQVVSAMTLGSIRLLKAGQQPTTHTVAGMRSDVILENLLGVTARPEEPRRQLAELDHMIQGQRFADAHELLNALESGIPGRDDPDVRAARWDLETEECGMGDEAD